MTGLLLATAMAGARAHAAAALTKEAAQDLIAEEELYPRPVYGLVAVPPKTKIDQSALAYLRKAGYVKDDRLRTYTVPLTREGVVEVLRNYPAYEVYAIRVKLCELDVTASSLEKDGKNVRVTGRTAPQKPTALLKELPEVKLADPELSCEPRPMTWDLRPAGSGYELVPSP
jgi:hypothetical protein